MIRKYQATLTIVSVALLAACGDSTRYATAPATADRTASARADAHAANHLVSMMDACDSTTFNAATQDPNTCLRRGGVTFQQFVAQLQKHQQVGAWHFAPPSLN